jgi:hypothetical protein
MIELISDSLTPSELDAMRDDILAQMHAAAAWSCVDCGVDTSHAGEFYMVHDAVWRAAGDIAGKLCIGCIEARLGRQLKPADFTDAKCNRFEDGYSPRLESRLGPDRDRSAQHPTVRFRVEKA